MRSKEEILKEVQKWSEENRGHTPSEKVLREELGIPKWDWINYWTKMTDLQNEAGLTPHVFDKTKYTKPDLCRLFVKVIGEYGKWPSRDVLDFKRKKDPNFPASATFYKQLGSANNGDLARTILEYVKDKRGSREIIKICNVYLENNIKPIEDLGTGVVGYVYLLKSVLMNATAYKIGKTKDVENRVRQLHQPSNQQELVYYIKTDDPDGVERYWHLRFEPKRIYPHKIKDEWFKLNSSDVKAFKRWKIF